VTEIGTSSPGVTIAIPGRPDAVLRLAWAAATDTGHRRQANEDSYVIQLPVFAVADGMGGHSAGDLASAAVVTRLAEAATGDFIGTDAVDRALDLATEDIDVVSVDRELGVGTTATGAILTLDDGNVFFGVFNVGDSRVYAFANDVLRQVTVDHSVVQEMVDAGMINREQADHHPDSNIITRAVGFGAPPSADYWMVPLETGVRLLVCSDGLTKELNDERLRLYLAAGLPPQETVDALVDAALSAGGRDNVTTVIVDVLEAPEQTDHDNSSPATGADEG
jgi:protein phosphatase